LVLAHLFVFYLSNNHLFINNHLFANANICQLFTLTSTSEGSFHLQVKLPPVITCQSLKSTVKCLAQGKTSELLAYFPHQLFNAEYHAR